MKHIIFMAAGLMISAGAFAQEPCPYNKDLMATKRTQRVASVLSTTSKPSTTRTSGSPTGEI